MKMIQKIKSMKMKKIIIFSSFIMAIIKFANGQSCDVYAGTISALKNTVCAGDSIHLMVIGSNAPIQWQSSLTPENFTDISGATDTIYSAPASQTKYFRVIANNGVCADTSVAFRIVVMPVPVVYFTWSIMGLTVNFDASGFNEIIYDWNFGDGSDSIKNDHIEHTYDSSGTYHVCLTVYNGSNCSFTSCHDVLVYPLGINYILNQNEFKVYPNPNKGLFTIIFIREIISGKIELFSITGQKICAENIRNNSHTFNIKKNGSQVYMLIITTEKDVWKRKIVVE